MGKCIASNLRRLWLSAVSSSPGPWSPESLRGLRACLSRGLSFPTFSSAACRARSPSPSCRSASHQPGLVSGMPRYCSGILRDIPRSSRIAASCSFGSRSSDQASKSSFIWLSCSSAICHDISLPPRSTKLLSASPQQQARQLDGLGESPRIVPRRLLNSD